MSWNSGQAGTIAYEIIGIKIFPNPQVTSEVLESLVDDLISKITLTELGRQIKIDESSNSPIHANKSLLGPSIRIAPHRGLYCRQVKWLHARKIFAEQTVN
ncbi:MAG: hypothetical protein IPI30_06200 [Saprospiraceae bacterium]|nr:hypothetical protein [Candidatus Vicinibacter affinis]